MYQFSSLSMATNSSSTYLSHVSNINTLPGDWYKFIVHFRCINQFFVYTLRLVVTQPLSLSTCIHDVPKRAEAKEPTWTTQESCISAIIVYENLLQNKLGYWINYIEPPTTLSGLATHSLLLVLIDFFELMNYIELQTVLALLRNSFLNHNTYQTTTLLNNFPIKLKSLLL